VAVRYPFKLVVQESAEREYLFDLSRDPDEREDLVGDPRYAAERAVLRETIVKIHANQKLLRRNRVWPGEPGPR
jgi:hypothetical protein